MSAQPALFDERPRYVVERNTNPHAESARWYVVNTSRPSGHWTDSGTVYDAFEQEDDATVLADALNAAVREGSL